MFVSGTREYVFKTCRLLKTKFLVGSGNPQEPEERAGARH